MRKTGLFDLLEKRILRSLLDYATGVETGLDSNGRKNRGGHLMEKRVESYLRKAGFIQNKTYFKEIYSGTIASDWGLNLSELSSDDKAEKKFDFAVKTKSMIYGLETNFYQSGGSKLNETARSYKMLALEAAKIDGFTFVWFTDGFGWKKARNSLEETFGVMEHIYNIADLEKGIMVEIFR
jgi:type II restriction enzyme